MVIVPTTLPIHFHKKKVEKKLFILMNTLNVSQDNKDPLGFNTLVDDSWMMMIMMMPGDLVRSLITLSYTHSITNDRN